MVKQRNLIPYSFLRIITNKLTSFESGFFIKIRYNYWSISLVHGSVQRSQYNKIIFPFFSHGLTRHVHPVLLHPQLSRQYPRLPRDRRVRSSRPRQSCRNAAHRAPSRSLHIPRSAEHGWYPPHNPRMRLQNTVRQRSPRHFAPSSRQEGDLPPVSRGARERLHPMHQSLPRDC